MTELMGSGESTSAGQGGRNGRVRAYVGLGSNVGDARATVRNAVRAIAALPGVAVRAVSPAYLTRPVGITDQPQFLNAVVALDVPGGRTPGTGALALLTALKQIEHALGRQERQRWGPREIDLDLLVFGRHLIHVGPAEGLWLKVPHASAHERLFVLAPLADLAPRLRPPGWHETVETARRRRLETEGEEAIQPAGTIF
ncbi:MAG TPA: 2-amino-4-hydroxy-6-hydroxymethyldihydropteridine diphosphokinase [Candidatus Limnocylindrales bacterium]|nr:2-amino-4-hydroxy-6-hydroxymethyldihydropteridine diphosphokinase [Candidatus Limnocylindrales bacterium]